MWIVFYQDISSLSVQDVVICGIIENNVRVHFYDQNENGLPLHWMELLLHTLETLGPKVLATRMVRDYVTDLYEPTAAAADVLRADDHARARTLAGWKARVAAAWDGVKIDRVDADDEVADLGTARTVEVAVELGTLDPADVAVQALHGPVGALDELADPLTVTDLTCVDPTTRPAVYRGEVPCTEPGRYGFTVRVVPTHPDLATNVCLRRQHDCWAHSCVSEQARRTSVKQHVSGREDRLRNATECDAKRQECSVLQAVGRSDCEC